MPSFTSKSERPSVISLFVMLNVHVDSMLFTFCAVPWNEIISWLLFSEADMRTVVSSANGAEGAWGHGWVGNLVRLCVPSSTNAGCLCAPNAWTWGSHCRPSFSSSGPEIPRSQWESCVPSRRIQKLKNKFKSHQWHLDNLNSWTKWSKIINIRNGGVVCSFLVFLMHELDTVSIQFRLLLLFFRVVKSQSLVGVDWVAACLQGNFEHIRKSFPQSAW